MVEPYPSVLITCPAFHLGSFDDNQSKSCESHYHELSLSTDPENILIKALVNYHIYLKEYLP